MDEFDLEETAEKICGLLDELGAKYNIHRKDDGEFSYLEEDELSIKLPNPYTERTMFIDLQGEISLYFADWHTHYYLDKTDYAELCETLTTILKNEICVGTVYLGSELKWHGSRLVLPTDIDNKPPFDTNS